MALTEEQKEIALRVAREMNYDPALNDLGAISKEEAMEFAARFLAALPKPEPVGHYMGEHKDGSDCVYLYRDVKKNQMLYTEAPIAPPASEQKPVAWKWRRHALDTWQTVGFFDEIEEAAAKEMESDAPELSDAWYMDDDMAAPTRWTPTPPPGGFWVLVSKFDTEDGPCAMFVRKIGSALAEALRQEGFGR